MFTGYHILIKFFRNGNYENDWHADRYKGLEKNSIEGDLQGVIDSLEYISEQGMDLIYLAPIFESQTTHGYDTINYFKIAGHLAFENDEKSKTLLMILIEKAHNLGIKIILDLVLNHASKEFDFKSIENEWHPKTEPPQSYQERMWQRSFCFWKESDSHTRNFLIYTGRYWLENFEIDGFRLDHAHGLTQTFWIEFMNEMKAIREDVILLGEIWNDNIPGLGNIDLMQSYVERGKECFTTLFHYEFYGALKLFLLEKKLAEKEFYEKAIRYPNTFTSEKFQWTYFLENHDIPRFVDLCNGDVDILIQALALMCAQSGNVLFEYGQEIALRGYKGGRNFYESGRVAMKFPMSWCKNEIDFNYKFLEILNLRKRSFALKKGKIEPILLQKGVLHIRKVHEKECVDVILVREGTYKKQGYDLISKRWLDNLEYGIYFLVEQEI